jgi:hypothetical protein
MGHVAALDLAAALQEHVNSQRRDDQKPIKEPGKALVNEYIQNAQSLSKHATDLAIICNVPQSHITKLKAIECGGEY